MAEGGGSSGGTSGEDVIVGFGVDLDGLKEGFAEAAKEVNEGAKHLGDGADASTAAMVALGGVIEGVVKELLDMARHALKESYAAFYELGESLEHMQHRLGGSMQELSYLKAGLESVGLTTQLYEGIARRLPQILQSHKEQFQAAGIAYHDAEGNLLPVIKTIASLTEYLEKFTEGSARNTEGVRLMGRAYYQMADMFELTAARQREATQVAREFGKVLDEEDKNATNEFGRQTSLLTIALEGFAVTVGRALVPQLTALATTVREYLVPVFELFRAIVAVVMLIIEGFRFSLFILIEVLGVVAARAALVVEMLAAVATLDTERFKRAWTAWKDVGIKAMDDIVDAAKAMNERIAHLVKGPDAAKEEPNTPDPHGKDKSAGDFAIAAAYAARTLALEKQRLTALSELNETARKQELIDEGAYWAKKLEIEQAGIDAEIAKLKRDKGAAAQESKQAFDDPEKRKLADARVVAAETQIMVLEAQRKDAAIKNQHDMTAAVEASTIKKSSLEIDHLAKMATAEADAEAERITQARAMREIDDAQQIEAMNAVELRKLEIEREALVKKRDLHRSWTEEYKAIQFQIEELDRKTANKRVELDNKAVNEQHKHWESLFKSMESGFKSVIEKFLNGFASIGDTIRGLFQSVVTGIVSMLAQIAAEWLVQQLVMLVTTKTTAASQLTAQIALAGAGGTASMAAAPWPLNMSAPLFGAAMAAKAAAYGALIAAPGFAVGAWDVPDDMVTKIHKGETILPAEDAAKFREGATGGGGDTHFHVSAVDARGVAQFFKEHGRAIAASMKHQGRNFYPAGQH